MTEITVKTVLKSLMGTIRKSKNPLAPIDEALSNAFEAILQKTFAKGVKPKITITLDYSGLLEDKKSLNQIIIEDNGLGFNRENYERFETLLDKSKGYNNRGSGRIQYVHRFNQVNVESYYDEEGKSFKLTFSFNANRFIFNKHNAPILDKHDSGSMVTLVAGDVLGNDQTYYDNLEVVDLVRNIKRKFVLRYYLESIQKSNKAPIIETLFRKNGKTVSQATIKPEDMPAPTTTGQVVVQHVRLKDPQSGDIEWETIPGKEEILKWAHFKLAQNDLDHNAVWLCSKGVTVSQLNYEAINKHEALKGNHYLTAFYGDVLDNEENVSDSVDSFTLPEQKVIEGILRGGDLYLPQDEFLFIDSIKDEINKAIPGIYKDILNIKKDQEARVEELAKQNGISIEIARKANVMLSDSKEKITDKIYKAQADYLSHESQKIRNKFDELENLNPTASDYQDQLEQRASELLNLIPQQNKEELGRYIIRRDMVAEVLRKILFQELDYQKSGQPKDKRKDKEGLIHDLIFKRRSEKNDQLNDLWMLDEEYVHFSGCSNIEVTKITDEQGKPLLRNITQKEVDDFGVKTKLKPDIFLFPDEGKCVLVELKNPEVDLAEHLNQLVKYCNLIANYSIKPIQKFYCYLIGENFNPITDLDGEWNETTNGDWIRNPIRIMSFSDKKREQIAIAQLEVMKLSSIYSRAFRRNKSFADKLGLRELIKNGVPSLVKEKLRSQPKKRSA